MSKIDKSEVHIIQFRIPKDLYHQFAHLAIEQSSTLNKFAIDVLRKEVEQHNVPVFESSIEEPLLMNTEALLNDCISNNQDLIKQSLIFIAKATDNINELQETRRNIIRSKITSDDYKKIVKQRRSQTLYWNSIRTLSGRIIKVLNDIIKTNQ